MKHRCIQLCKIQNNHSTPSLKCMTSTKVFCFGRIQSDWE